MVPTFFNQYPGPNQVGQANGLLPITFTVNSGALAPSTGISLLVAGPLQVFHIAGGNVTGGAAYLKLYDQAVTFISGVQQTSLSSIPATASYMIPGNVAGAGTNIHLTGLPANLGGQFFQGLTALVTANAALADQSATSTGVNVTIWYKQ
jgi:hypothetical protein